MAEEKDVKPVEEETTPVPSTEEASDGKSESEEDATLGEPLEDTEKPESTEETGDDSGAEAEAEAESEPDKDKQEIENLKVALRKEREKNRKVSEPTTAPARPQATPKIDTDPLSKKLVEANEKEALTVLYQEFPDLAPENDLDNSLFNKFQRGYKVLVEVDGDLPVTKEAILAKGREVMGHLRPSKPLVSKKIEQQAEAANLGKPSSGKPRPMKTVTEADRRAAKLAGMSTEEYMKFKNTFQPDDEVPI
jgi:hypothetical protein